MRICFLLWPLLVLILAGCRGPQATGPADAAPTSMTMLDRQLLEVIELEQQLDSTAAEEDAEYREVQRQFETVAQLYRGILARNPDSLETRLLYGKLLSRFNDPEGALEQFEAAASLIQKKQAALEANPDPDFSKEELDAALAVVYQDQSTVFAEMGDSSLALHFAQRTVELQPDQAAYQFGLGQVIAAFREELVRDNLFTADVADQLMMSAFHRAMELEPDSIELQFRYGEAFYDTSQPDWEAALAHWKSLAQNDRLSTAQRDATLLHQARCLAELGQVEEARRTARRVSTPNFRGSAETLFED